MPTYDAKQMGAVLTTCQRCGRATYMTHPSDLCIACQRVAQRVLDALDRFSTKVAEQRAVR